MNFGLIFITGLTSGGVSCAALQGGLLMSLVANRKDKKWLVPVAVFVLTKLLAHVLLGMMLGWLGAVFQVSINVVLFFQLLTAIYLLVIALNMLGVSPILRYMELQPSKIVYKKIRRSGALLAGLLTLVIPCGVTMAMELKAISSGSWVTGAMIMGIFILGTTPALVMIGLVTGYMSNKWQNTMRYVSAGLLILMSLITIKGIFTVGWTPNTQNMLKQTSISNEKVQRIRILVGAYGYQPNNFKVQKGQPVELTLESRNNYSCASMFIFKAFNIKTTLEPNDTQVFTFVPETKGSYGFSCAMGMFTGMMEVY